MLNIHKLLDLLPMILAIAAGILAYKKLPLFYRILFIQVLLFTATDLYAASKANNAWIYNISMIVEISLVFFAAHTYFHTIISKRLLLILSSLFLLILGLDIYHLGFYQLAYHAYVGAAILITGVYMTILSYHFLKRNDKYETLPLVLTCVGLIIYFAGLVPLVSNLYYFQKKNPELNKLLFQCIVVIPGLIRYLCIAIAFFLLGRMPFNPSTKTY